MNGYTEFCELMEPWITRPVCYIYTTGKGTKPLTVFCTEALRLGSRRNFQHHLPFSWWKFQRCELSRWCSDRPQCNSWQRDIESDISEAPHKVSSSYLCTGPTHLSTLFLILLERNTCQQAATQTGADSRSPHGSALMEDRLHKKLLMTTCFYTFQLFPLFPQSSRPFFRTASQTWEYRSSVEWSLCKKTQGLYPTSQVLDAFCHIIARRVLSQWIIAVSG